MPTLLLPNAATIKRREDSGSRSNSGQTIWNTVVLQSAIPCKIDALPAGSRMGGDLTVEVEGVIYVQTHVLFIPGLPPAQVTQNEADAGDVIAYRGIQYVVTPNAEAALVDVAPQDSITDENGRIYLALAVAKYYVVTPNVQVRLQIGRSWETL